MDGYYHNRHSRWIASLTLAMTGIAVLFPIVVSARPETSPTKYPRIYNHYLTSIKREDYDRLAEYDIVTMIPEAQYYYPDLFPYLRKKNPNIIILPYIYSQSVNTDSLDDPAGLKRAFYDFATEARYLHTASGKRILLWQDILWAANLASDWPDLLPALIQEKVLSTGLWDGIFFDMVESRVGHYANGDIDINNDGTRDSADTVNQVWREGMIRLLKKTREVIGPDKYILINGDSFDGYQPYANGRFFESFPTPWEGRGRWEDTVRPYLALPKLNVSPTTLVLNTTIADHGGREDYQQVRYTVASALLGDGYVSVDESIASHAQLWWYDEYNARLGRPTNGPRDVLEEKNETMRPSVWRRDFQQGIALVNATDKQQTIRFREEFEKIHGVQDPRVNDGSIASSVTLPPKDGIILLRPLEQIVGGAFLNGSFVRVFMKDGRVSRTGFFAYDPRWRGGSTVLVRDLDRDGVSEIVVATERAIEVWGDDGARRVQFFPYGEGYSGGVALAVGDLDGDRAFELVTAPVNDTSVHIKIWSSDGKFIRSFFPFGGKVRGGASVAVGDVNGDGRGEVIVGAGKGSEPRVFVFSSEGSQIGKEWLVAPKTFRGGIYVAAGDLDGDRKAEIITGTGVGGGPQVRIFSGAGKVLHPGWFAYSERARGGVRVLAHDLDNDGKAEILTMTTDVFTVTASRK